MQSTIRNELIAATPSEERQKVCMFWRDFIDATINYLIDQVSQHRG